MVFDNLRVMRDYEGYVVFLEEDHYVAPDFIQVTHQLVSLKQAKSPDTDFINLGMYNKVRALNNRVSTSTDVMWAGWLGPQLEELSLVLTQYRSVWECGMQARTTWDLG